MMSTSCVDATNLYLIVEHAHSGVDFRKLRDHRDRKIRVAEDLVVLSKTWACRASGRGHVGSRSYGREIPKESQRSDPSGHATGYADARLNLTIGWKISNSDTQETTRS
jgi:hypothetical protein